jgi:hypothetical protein
LKLPNQQFTTIIELDIFLFGLIYYILFENKEIDIDEKDALIKELEDASSVFKNNYAHSKAPSALKYLKERIDKSIEIAEKYAS